MPFNVNEILATWILPAFKGLGKTHLKATLAKIQEHNTPELYVNTLKSINSSFSLLKDVAVKSKTKVDDDVIDLILEAVRESAAEDNVIL